jgi:hypothetical protein
MYSLFTLLLTLVFLVNTTTAAASSTAEFPDVMTIMKKMKEALEPMRPSKRKMIITIKSEGDTVQWVAGQALKNFPDGKRMLIVMLEPADIKGIAFLVCERKEKPDKPDLMYVYLPALRRTKEIKGLVNQYQSFLGTDFNFADFGFIKLHKYYFLLGEENHGAVQAYKIESKVPEEKEFFSRIFTWVAADNFLPLQRDYYNQVWKLWKTELFEDVSVINGVPTALRIKMKDLILDGSTDLYLSDVEYDTAIPDSLFDPKGLRQVSTHECWQQYCTPPAMKK